MKDKKIGFALCGSFCTLKSILPELQRLVDSGADVIPIMSELVYNTDTRFGTAIYFIDEVEKITNGIATEYDFGTVNIDVDVYAQSLTIIPISQVKVSTDYTIKRMIEWSRAIEEKVVATFTIEHFGAFTIDVERIKTNVNLEGEAHGHGHGKGHGHGHGDVPNAGGSIVDAL